MSEQIIPCPKGCPPASTPIWRESKTLRWQFVPVGDGTIEQVTDLPHSIFTNPRPDGADFLWDYMGDTTPGRTWPYETKSDPECLDLAEAQLTNGPIG